MTQAYLIDPEAKMVSIIDVDGYQDINKHIGSRCFTIATILENEDTVFVDDEGLLSAGNLSFIIKGAHQPFFGRGVVQGCTPSGRSIAPRTTLLDLAERVSFDPQYTSGEV